LNPYGLFADDAIQLYKTLPEEQSELYKRKFVSIGPETILETFKGAEKPQPDTPEALQELAKSLFSSNLIKFDAIISGTGHVIGPNAKYITVLAPSEIKMDILDRKLYKSSDDKLAALIHAFTNVLVFIDLPKGAKANMNIMFVNSSGPLAAQVMINCGEESELNLLEWYASGTKDRSASLVMHESGLQPFSKASIDAIHNETENTIVTGLSKYNVGKSAVLRLNYFYNGGFHTRVKNQFGVVDVDGSVHANELIFGSASQKFDISSYMENAAQATTAELHSKAVLMGESFCIMKGFAKIPFGSKNARSYVHEAGMLLDKSAYLESIPAMSIDENEVKATHSSATGPIDDELVFYLMSKGLDESKARKLLVEGFFSSSLGRFKSAEAKLATASLVAEKISTGKFGDKLNLTMENVWVGRENEEDIFKGHYKYR
jgi:Fe-S cluster assembly scaffold protein SufB